jgi:hypothetical protein
MNTNRREFIKFYSRRFVANFLRLAGLSEFLCKVFIRRAAISAAGFIRFPAIKIIFIGFVDKIVNVFTFASTVSRQIC